MTFRGDVTAATDFRPKLRGLHAVGDHPGRVVGEREALGEAQSSADVPPPSYAPPPNESSIE